MTEITFLCPPELEGKIPEPQPAARFLPEWFRALPREMGLPDAHGLPGLTVKSCLPVADAMGLGWIIPLPFDVWTTLDPGTNQLHFHWDPACPFPAVEAHHPGQIGADKPPFQGLQPLKFNNPWRVVVPKGWSVQFVHPMNHFELPFVAFNGAVDCDALQVPVNMPFFWQGAQPDIRLPAGTPMVQVIPYQRAAMPRRAGARGETDDEARARADALDRKYAEESVYAREWRRRHDREKD